MPNNVINELVFRANANQQLTIRAALCGDYGNVDFRVLVPVAINTWWFSVGKEHEETFERTALGWCS